VILLNLLRLPIEDDVARGTHAGGDPVHGAARGESTEHRIASRANGLDKGLRQFDPAPVGDLHDLVCTEVLCAGEEQR
jgi:hypothetical protein